jgi:7-cyano-7-deazaguanine synthase
MSDKMKKDVTLPMRHSKKGEKAVVVFSGGQDSTTCLLLAIHMHGVENVICVTFHYGQRHVAEIDAAKHIALNLGVQTHRIVEVALLGQLATNALVNHAMPIGKEEGAKYPNTVVDGRNLIFLTAAAVLAKQLGVIHLYTGVCETDFSGYPDCRDVFVRSCNVTLNLAMDYPFQIHTPLMWLNKCQTWAMADLLGHLEMVTTMTVTCYQGLPGYGCGECPACLLRRKGLNEYREYKNDESEEKE